LKPKATSTGKRVPTVSAMLCPSGDHSGKKAALTPVAAGSTVAITAAVAASSRVRAPRVSDTSTRSPSGDSAMVEPGLRPPPALMAGASVGARRTLWGRSGPTPPDMSVQAIRLPLRLTAWQP
jgi:hypothetical protein